METYISAYVYETTIAPYMDAQEFEDFHNQYYTCYKCGGYSLTERCQKCEINAAEEADIINHILFR